MRRLPLVLLAVALPALAQEPDGMIDAGAPEETSAEVAPEAADAGTPAVVPEPVAQVGRHFAYTWDAVGPERGQTDVQLWLTTRWGRPESYLAADLRGGVLQGLGGGWALGFFVDATPSSTGVTEQAAIDGRLTAHLAAGVTFGPISAGGHWELGLGPNGVTLSALLAADAQLGAVRIGLNADVFTDAKELTRARQTLALSYTLSNGFCAGVELQNRLSWRGGRYGGDAFLIGPAVAYRGEHLWWSLTLLPQVAAVKAADKKGIGDPLELTDNERFSLRISLGVIP